VIDKLWPAGYRLETLVKAHPRKLFVSGKPTVDDWLQTKALQNQSKHLSTSKVLIDESDLIAGFYTTAQGQIQFRELPSDATLKLPDRPLPVAILAWLGVAQTQQGKGLGKKLLVQALRDCLEGGNTFPFVAVILDSIDDAAKSFYKKFDFAELPDHPYRLYLPTNKLVAMMQTN
jgi:GNAT superfamily N-acetyltransferase